MKDLSCPLCKEESVEIQIKEVGAVENVSEIVKPETRLESGASRRARVGITSGPSTQSTNLSLFFQSVAFCNLTIAHAARSLLTYQCPYCAPVDERFIFRTLGDLHTHLMRDHQKSHCTLCLSGRQQCFLSEQFVFAIPDLERHKLKGEPQGIDPHPQCDFCRGERFFSADELNLHMRQKHFLCSVCDHLNYPQEWYTDYASLSEHQHDSHYPCFDEDCLAAKFVVFPDPDSLRVHQIECHIDTRGMSKGSKRAAMTLAVQYSGPGLVGGLKRKKERNPGVPDRRIKFRGPKRSADGGAGDVLAGAIDSLFPPLTFGASYDPLIHSKLPANRLREGTKTRAAPQIKRQEESPSSSSATTAHSQFALSVLNDLSRAPTAPLDTLEEYRKTNTALKQRLGVSLCDRLQPIAHAFKDGMVSADAFLTQAINELSGVKNGKNLLVELIVLSRQKGKPARAILADALADLSRPVTPTNETFDSLVDSGVIRLDGRLSFISAVNKIIRPLLRGKSLPIPAALRPLRLRIGELDAVQLETLSDFRSQILAVEPRLSFATAAEQLTSLRPMFHRLMHIPADHERQKRELSVSGWLKFTRALHQLLTTKLSTEELVWLGSYVEIALDRLRGLGQGKKQPEVTFMVPEVDRKVVVGPRSDEFPTLVSSGTLGSSLNSGSSWATRQQQPRLESIDTAEMEFPSLVELFPGRERPVAQPEQPAIPKKTKKGTLLLSTGGRRNR